MGLLRTFDAPVRSEVKRVIMIALLFVLPVLTSIVWWQRRGEQRKAQLQYDTPVSVAVVAPVGTPKGRAIANAAQLLETETNVGGGIGGRPLKVVIIDEGNDPVAAAKAALATEPVAIVGHMGSAATLAASPIYKTARVPVITPSATNDAVTADNPWMFSAIFNDSQQGRVLAAYTQHALGRKDVMVVCEPGVYGEHLSSVFRTQAAEQGLVVLDVVTMPADPALLAPMLNPATRTMPGAVFVAGGVKTGAHVLKALREQGYDGVVIGPDAMANEALISELQQLRDPLRDLSNYTDNLYVAMPLIFDTANSTAQRFRKHYVKRFALEPLWHAGYAYDALAMLVAGMRASNATGARSAQPQERESLRAFLVELNGPSRAIVGVTGATYFAPERYAPKPATMAVYRGSFVSALVQLRPMRQRAVSGEGSHGVRVGQSQMALTHVVYTGMNMRRISAVNPDKATAEVEFDLWFRFQPPLDANRVEFANSLEPIELGKPRHATTHGALAYEAYRVKGTFKLDAVPGAPPPLEQHVVGVGMRHMTKGANEVLYVADVLGLHDGPDAGEIVVDPELKLEIKENWISQETTKRHVLGDPTYLFDAGATIEQSTLFVAARVAPSTFTVRRRLNLGLVDNLLLVGVMGVFFLYAAGRFTARRPKLAAWLWLFECLAWGAVVLLAEVFILEVVVPRQRLYTVPAVKLFDVLWWGVLAVSLVTGLDRLVWGPIETRTGRPIPRVAKQFASWIVWILCGFGVLAFAFNQKITGLLATSGLVAMIIGLAIQMNISNIFSGIVLNLERPFRIGDWIDISGKLGQVVDVSWRATKIQPRSGEVISIPNAVAAAAQIINYSFPNPTISINSEILVDPQHSPDQVEELLRQAVREAEPQIREVEPGWEGAVNASYQGVDARAAFYKVGTVIGRYEHRGGVIGAINKNVWRLLNANGIRMLSQQTTVRITDERGRSAVVQQSPEPAANASA